MKSIVAGICIVILFSAIVYGQDREPAVAGAFYPADSKALARQIGDYLREVKIDYGSLPKGELVGFVVPHAGYPYSGAIAAYDYKLLEGKKYDTVVVLGANHRARGFRDISIYNEGLYKTPLGNVPIDVKFANAIINKGGFTFFSRAHAQEHSVEVQVPFLQVVLKDFKVVPVVMGDYSTVACKRLAEAIIDSKGNRKILVIASSDLSHDKKYDRAVEMDKLGLSYVKDLNTEGLIKAYSAGKTEMCGYGPALTFLFYAKNIGSIEGVLLKYANSGDVVGNKNSRIVGYGSVVFFKQNDEVEQISEGGDMSKENSLSNEFTDEQRKSLLGLARKSITNSLAEKEEEDREVSSVLSKFKENRGVFVTLHKKGQLRGCIGYIEPIKPLGEAVADNAINAATRDFRFPTVKSSELADIDIEISVLTVPREIKGPEEFVPGKHGIIIKKGFKSAVFLPQVAPEQGWGTDETLTHLCMKAGLAPDEWKEPGMKFLVFTAEVFGEKK